MIWIPGEEAAVSGKAKWADWLRTTLTVVVALLALASAAAPQTREAAAGIPTPESVLGFRVGDDFKLASYDQSIAYFKALDAASDRVELRRVGRTSEGRDWYIALISSPENLARIEHYREISLRLAHPAGLAEEEARRLAADGGGGLYALLVSSRCRVFGVVLTPRRGGCLDGRRDLGRLGRRSVGLAVGRAREDRQVAFLWPEAALHVGVDQNVHQRHHPQQRDQDGGGCARPATIRPTK